MWNSGPELEVERGPCVFYNDKELKTALVPQAEMILDSKHDNVVEITEKEETVTA